jgi:MinD superfamily P-loop ATPase
MFYKTIYRDIIHIDENKCDGCGKCLWFCVEGALKIIDAKARLSADKYCDGCGACAGKCPSGSLYIAKRHAEEFQELVYVKC